MTRRMSSSNDGINLPFEPGSFELPDADGTLACGIVVMAAVVDVPNVGPMPTLVFRFANPDGTGFYPPTILVCEDDDIIGLPPLVAKAVEAAITAADRARLP